MIKELDNKKKTQRRKNENTEGTRGDMEMSSDSDNDVANVQPSQEKEKDEKTLRIEEAIKQDTAEIDDMFSKLMDNAKSAKKGIKTDVKLIRTIKSSMVMVMMKFRQEAAELEETL